jgi:deoxycytidine triphosphate deaminase
MILPDREIKKLLAKKLIRIDPPPGSNAYASTSVNLTLDALLQVFRAVGPGVIINPRHLRRERHQPIYPASAICRNTTGCRRAIG